MSNSKSSGNEKNKKEELVVDESHYRVLKKTFDAYSTEEVDVKKEEVEIDDTPSSKGISKKQVKFIKGLTPELKSVAKKLFRKVKDEDVQKLQKLSHDEENKLVSIKSTKKSLLSEEEQKIFVEKLKEFDVSEEEAQLTTSAVLSWFENMELEDL